MHPILQIVVGLVAAGLGGELFVRGSVGLAQWARIPAGIIGATVAAFATSSPELAVSISAAAAGTPQIALGDALGSNVVNLGLVLGVALLFGPIRSGEGSLKRDFPLAIATPLLTVLAVMDGKIARWEGAVLAAIFLAWLTVCVRDARDARSATEEVLGEKSHWRSVAWSLLGLVLLITAGRTIVGGAKYVGDWLGWSPFVVGATLVAIGTSMPELATAVISRIRGHDEVGLGTLIGSNLFNGLFIVSVAALITPIAVKPTSVLAGLSFGLLTVLASTPRRDGQIARWRGFLLLGLYAAYVVVLVS